MHFKTLLSTLALVSTTLAIPSQLAPRDPVEGSVYVINRCTTGVYIWSVASEVSARSHISPNETWTETLRHDPLTGIAVKIGTDPEAIGNASPLVHFSYSLNLNETSIYYDLSTVIGFPQEFEGHKIVVEGTGTGVPSIEWWGGKPSGTKAWNGKLSDFYIILCDDP